MALTAGRAGVEQADVETTGYGGRVRPGQVGFDGRGAETLAMDGDIHASRRKVAGGRPGKRGRCPAAAGLGDAARASWLPATMKTGIPASRSRPMRDTK